mmetsp:Transcript_10883/g.32266  ORF Transcript_10883/g.32266 Transcript_10883/m.32266 type:complete len:425 (-) Transcript_10883:614-1888(-)
MEAREQLPEMVQHVGKSKVMVINDLAFVVTRVRSVLGLNGGAQVAAFHDVMKCCQSEQRHHALGGITQPRQKDELTNVFPIRQVAKRVPLLVVCHACKWDLAERVGVPLSQKATLQTGVHAEAEAALATRDVTDVVHAGFIGVLLAGHVNPEQPIYSEKRSNRPLVLLLRCAPARADGGRARRDGEEQGELGERQAAVLPVLLQVILWVADPARDVPDALAVGNAVPHDLGEQGVWLAVHVDVVGGGGRQFRHLLRVMAIRKVITSRTVLPLLHGRQALRQVSRDFIIFPYAHLLLLEAVIDGAAFGPRQALAELHAVPAVPQACARGREQENDRRGDGALLYRCLRTIQVSQDAARDHLDQGQHPALRSPGLDPQVHEAVRHHHRDHADSERARKTLHAIARKEVPEENLHVVEQAEATKNND